MTAGNQHLPIAPPPALSAGWGPGGGWNPNGGPWDDDARGHLALWARRQAGATFTVVVAMETVDDQQQARTRYLHFVTAAGAPYMWDGQPRVPIGAGFADGDWHYLEFNLQPELHKLLTDETILHVEGVMFYGEDLLIWGMTYIRGALVIPLMRHYGP